MSRRVATAAAAAAAAAVLLAAPACFAEDPGTWPPPGVHPIPQPPPTIAPWAPALIPLPPYDTPRTRYDFPEEPLPGVIKWNEGEVIPLGYHHEQRARAGLIVGGALMFGWAWVPSAIVGGLSQNGYLAIPLAGPFITAATFSQSCATDGGGCGNTGDPVLTFWLVFDGLQQTAGVAMLIAGMAAKKTVLVRDEVKVSRTWWLPIPVPLGARGAGLGFVGTM